VERGPVGDAQMPARVVISNERVWGWTQQLRKKRKKNRAHHEKRPSFGKLPDKEVGKTPDLVGGNKITLRN